MRETSPFEKGASGKARFIGVGILVVASVTACGGGGGGGSSQPPTVQPPTTQPPTTNPPPVNRAPVADAGAPQTVGESQVVQLDASASADADGDSLTYEWQQTSGPTVTLSNVNSAEPTFVALSDLSADEALVFELVVNDGKVDSAPSAVTLTVRAADPSAAGGFVSVVSAALAAGQFTFNNPWTQGDLTYENINANIGYQDVKDDYTNGQVNTYTTLVSQYQARRRQCEEDHKKSFPRTSWTNYLNSNWVYHFTDRACYPTLQTAADLEESTTGDPLAQQLLKRYGYYCGAEYPQYSAFGAGTPEPLDGVDYCCRLHDEGAWGDRGDYSNECGIAMCLRQVTAMPSGILNALPDVQEARTHWYGEGAFGGASFVCPGNQSNSLPPPVFGP